MATQSDQEDELERLKGMPIRSEEIGFSPDQLKQCVKCGKPNAPDRAACLYCGKEFESGKVGRLNIRELESWEKGFNVVLVDIRNANADAAARELSSVLGTEAETLKQMLGSGYQLPVARLESESLAERVADRFADLGIECRIIADEVLNADTRPVRLRSIEFENDAIRLIPFNTGGAPTLRHEAVALIVIGMIIEDRTESVTRRGRRDTKVLNESQVSHDEPVIDIYSRQDATGWRIPATGFDFSCLGADKTLLASDNMRRLIARLAEFSPSAKIADQYGAVRSLLEHCWTSESEKDARMVGARVGRKDVESVVRRNNLGQWTKYSRLQRHLL